MEKFCSDNTNHISVALLKVQQEMSPATKDGNNPFTKSKYATLNSVMEACREPLVNNGILLTQAPVPPPDYLGGGYLGLMTKLIHAESGQWISSLTVIPLPKSDPQGMGSAITYARRYALTAMLGMITEDDDGEAAKVPVKSNYGPSNTTSSIGKNQQRTTGKHPSQPATANNCYPDESEDADPALPQLEGVTYQYITTQDGRQCIIATGNTLPKKEILRGAGFAWNPQQKCWWKYADAS